MRIPPPVAAGALRISGRPRDGGTVRAAGLRWLPGRLPPGDRLLSFEVEYHWRSCPASGLCARAADSTATPFAAARYVVGHADTGRRLRLTEIAAEVVETNPATFSFTVIRASASVLSAAPVARYPASLSPRTEFVDGTPEHRTASREEYFQVDPPHYAASSGAPVQDYRGRSWDLAPDATWPGLLHRETRYRATLGVGAHARTWPVRPRCGSGGGSCPSPRAPLACVVSRGTRCWLRRTLNSRHRPMRWDWQIGRAAPLERTGARAVDLYDIDGVPHHRRHESAPFTGPGRRPHTAASKKTICYLDLAWEDYRPDGSPAPRGAFPAATLGNIYFGFPQEPLGGFPSARRAEANDRRTALDVRAQGLRRGRA